MTLVTAIITTHNRKKLLKRAIDSVLHQTYNNIECIVVDDHSDDGTNDLCLQYPVQYIYIPFIESKGGNYARNKGIKAAKGKYIAFLDDDDYWLPTKIEKQVALLESKGCELVYCGKTLEYVLMGRNVYKQEATSLSGSGDMSKKILYNICTTTTNILAKRSALFEVGLFDENLKFWQEYELMIRLAQRKPFYFVNEPLSVYRIDANDKYRLTNKYFEWKNAVKFIHNKHYNLYNQLTILEKFRVKLLIWEDAKIRSKASGLFLTYIYYLLITIPFYIFHKIKSII